MKQSKVPKAWPTYILKCVWDSTALRIKIQAKDQDDALDRAWKLMRRTEGGEGCKDIVIKEIR